MTYPELQIQFDLNPDNRINILMNVDTCRLTDYGYLFVDQYDGQCYLFDKNGCLDDICKVRRIRICAFENCTSLAYIKIPESVESIGYCAFWDCTSLINIRIPSSVKDIGDWAFICCPSLKEVVFEGKTIDQVEAMDWYPWGIEDESVIKVES